jgi:hypothetical protein
MQQFILNQNIQHFEKLLAATADPLVRHTLERLLATHKRQLALLQANGFHRTGRFLDTDDDANWDQFRIDEFYPDFETTAHPLLVLKPAPGLPIIDINPAYANATMTVREDVRGHSLFDVFPDNPDHATADGVHNLFSSLKAVVETGEPNIMKVQRYDIRDPAGKWVVRHWQPINTPLFTEDRKLAYILHHVEDVTADAAKTAAQA